MFLYILSRDFNYYRDIIYLVFFIYYSMQFEGESVRGRVGKGVVLMWIYFGFFLARNFVNWHLYWACQLFLHIYNLFIIKNYKKKIKYIIKFINK